MKLPLAVAAALEKTFNLLIGLDPESRERLVKLQGQIIRLQLQGPDLPIFLLIHADSIEVMSDFDGDVDTTIAGQPAAMLAMRSSNRGLFSGDVEVSGNLETGKQFKRYLDALEIDWEEQLSQVVGDSIAYQVGSFFRGAEQYFRNSSNSLKQNLGEYITEEAELIAPHSETEHFAAEVDELRERFDRLLARVERLEKEQGSNR